MKFFLLILLTISTTTIAQNFQLHYDFGENRNFITTTFEMYKSDEYGSTYFFVDFNFDNPENNSLSLAYFEIARYFNLPFIDKLSATIQYNDGMIFSRSLGQTWLGGLTYPLEFGIVTLSTSILYRKTTGTESSDVQITFTWNKNLFDNKMQIKGFMDIWTKQNDDSKNIVILWEPQIWYNIDKHLSVGSELEISKNFLPSTNWELMPTLAARWNF